MTSLPLPLLSVLLLPLIRKESEWKMAYIYLLSSTSRVPTYTK